MSRSLQSVALSALLIAATDTAFAVDVSITDTLDDTAGIDPTASYDHRLRAGFATIAHAIDVGTGADGACTVSGWVDISTASCVGRAEPDAAAFDVTSPVAAGAASVTLASTPTGLAVGDEILIIVLQGGGAALGTYETRWITDIAGATLALDRPLDNAYDGSASAVAVQRVPNYTSVDIATSSWLAGGAWNGNLGGVLFFRATGVVDVTGSLYMAARGYRGGSLGSTSGVEHGNGWAALNGGTGGYGGGGVPGYGCPTAADVAPGPGTNGAGGGGAGAGAGRPGGTGGSRGGGGGGGGGNIYGGGGAGGQANGATGTNSPSVCLGAGGGGGGASYDGGANPAPSDLGRLIMGGGGSAGAGGGAAKTDHSYGAAGGTPHGGLTAGQPGGGILVVAAQGIVDTGARIYASGGAGGNGGPGGPGQAPGDFWANAAGTGGGGGGSGGNGAAGGSMWLGAFDLDVAGAWVSGGSYGSGGAGGPGGSTAGTGGAGANGLTGAGGVRVAHYVDSSNGIAATQVGYPAAASIRSTNLLDGQTVDTLLQVAVSVSALPVGATASVSFSSDGATFVDAAGVAGAAEPLTAGANTIDISGLGWTGADFYWQIDLTSDGTAAADIDDVGIIICTDPDDSDGDGIGDDCDDDVDGDGVADVDDNCPTAANPAQTESEDPSDGSGDACDACTDSDGDGYGDGGVNASGEPLGIDCPLSDTVADNCPQAPNPSQTNTDGQPDGGDACDDDDDGDGVDDVDDNCDLVDNPAQDDADDDGIGDACDDDNDNDGTDNGSDNCPFVANAGQLDADEDGDGDACDGCTDSDGDGFGDGAVNADGEQQQLWDCSASAALTDNCPDAPNAGQLDLDLDGWGDACDPCTDADDDGWGDDSAVFDISGCPSTAGGCAGPADPACVPFEDNCATTANADQADLDADGTGDACDGCTDQDGDGYGTAGLDRDGCAGATADNCPDIANPSQGDADADTLGDACDVCTDTDDDGLGDPAFPFNSCPDDNCPAVANPAQDNADLDAFGDACDTCTDSDGDGFGDPGLGLAACAGSDATADNCPAMANPAQLDTDLDGAGNACDLDDDDDSHLDSDEIALLMDPLDPDSDGDLIADWDELFDAAFAEDTDLDSVIDALDDDSDGDSVLDLDEGGDNDLDTVPVDTDGDGTPDFRDVDSDDDGVADGDDNCRLVSNADQADADANDFGDACDDDRDGDGVANADDNCADLPNPGQEDYDGDGQGDDCEAGQAHLEGPGCRLSTLPGTAGWGFALALVAVMTRRRRAA